LTQVHRIGFAKMANVKTMGQMGLAAGPNAIKQIHEQSAGIPKEKRRAWTPRWSRPTIHYPTHA